ncbi:MULTISPECIES: DoxX family protein [unclassified Streptomyces]|uniref:DoxX family protein n=1 Tax=unclassified Streptomyces TaxID=2593676 RepID=UPI002E10E989|nr:DoxX family protein [Streptomyces sp. NBC_01207]WTA16787.1 DoxX family protein [Streptomyces sp. NBC_00853]
MNTTLWIIAGALALMFLAAGLTKISQPREKLAASGMAWTADFSPGAVKTVGAVEVLGAVGLILPAALGIAPALAAWAAFGLVATMLGATVLHLRRKEATALPVALLLLALAAVVAWGRFGPYAF